MPEPYPAPRAQPILRRQRLVRVGEETTLVGPASSHIAPVPVVAGPALPTPILERQVRLAIGASRLLREAQPLLEAEHTSTATQEVLGLVQMLLQVLLGALAAGADARVAQITGMFALLLNAPGHAGLLEQGLQALRAPATLTAPARRSAGDPAVLEALRWRHRDLVALSLGWEALLDLALPTGGGWSAAPGRPANVTASWVPPLLTPLPPGVVVTQPGTGGWSGALARCHCQAPPGEAGGPVGARVHALGAPQRRGRELRYGKGSMGGR